MNEQYQCYAVTRAGKRCQRRCDSTGFCSSHPATGGLVTKTGFALMQGVDQSMVSKWLKAGVFDDTEDGYIEWETAQASIAATRDFSRPLQRQGAPHRDAEVPGQVALDDVDLAEYNARYIIGRALEKEESARLKTLERLKLEEELLDARQVVHDFHDLFATLRQQFRTLPGRAVGKVRGAKNAREAQTVLLEEIDRALTTVADTFAEIYEDRMRDLEESEGEFAEAT